MTVDQVFLFTTPFSRCQVYWGNIQYQFIVKGAVEIENTGHLKMIPKFDRYGIFDHDNNYLCRQLSYLQP